jgi:hypothetical protein
VGKFKERAYILSLARELAHRDTSVLPFGSRAMRVCVTLAIALTLAVGTSASAQPKKDGEKAAAVPTSREILANLRIEVEAAPFRNQNLRFEELLEVIREAFLKKMGREITFNIDEEAFREEAPDAPKIPEAQVNFKSLPPKTTVHQLLRQALNQLPVQSALIVRAGRVDLVPASRATKPYMLNQTFHVDFKERPLSAALEDLSELTGVSIVMDARAKEKAQTPVTARFHDDVALQDAVRMLTDMAELKIVYLVTGLYVTTAEHATAMQKELKQIYDTPANLPAGFGPAAPGLPAAPGVPPGGAPAPQLQMIQPQTSPLAPPLPPVRQVGGAAA